MATTMKRDNRYNNRPLSDDENEGFFRSALIQIGCSFLFMAALACLVYYETIRLYPTSMSADTVKGYAGRVEFALRYQTLLFSWLAFNIIAAIYTRDTTKAFNPLDEKSEQNISIQRIKCILQNSYEQAILSAFAQLIFVSFASPECILKTIPLVNIMHLIGRIAFFYGYPHKRAFGFPCSMVPTILLLVYNIYSFVMFLFKK